jgi:hypothetical protein
MLDPSVRYSSSRPDWPWLVLIVVVYVVIASLYAIKVPAWQAPDEPAHYNYVHELASTGLFPILRQGDYDQAYLERLKSEQFPPELSIEPVRYEAHQPPLYYLLASGVFRATGGQLLFLRLFSVALGAGFILLTYAIVRSIYPQRPRLRLAAAAFVAFLPMHVAIAASVNNDALAEVVLAGILLLCIRYIKQSIVGPTQPRWTQALALGVLLGLALVTKVSAYVAIPVALGTLLIVWYETRRAPLLSTFQHPSTPHSSPSTLFTHAALIFLPALLIALPWYARNAQVYGHLDILGRRWHDLVVVGQLRTADFVGQAGPGALAERMAVWSFDSFWGVFGWMGVWMDGRLYTALLAFSLAAAVGCGALVVRKCRVSGVGVSGAEVSGVGVSGGGTSGVKISSTSHPAGRFRVWSLALLALAALLTLGIYVSYNAIFVQPQGRYLFPALPALALAVALGWEEVVSRPRAARWASWVVLATAGLAALIGVLREGINKWSLGILGGAAVALAGWSWGVPRVPEPWRGRLVAAAFGLPFVALPLLDLYALHAFILPQLT